MKPRLGVLFSGGGRTLVNLAQATVDGSLPAEIVLGISSHAGVAGLARCAERGIPTCLFEYREHGDALSARAWEALDEAAVDWVALAGFIRYLEIPPRYAGRVLNIHPALLPAFGGRGYYGARVHRAVIESGARVSGCTVHFVDSEYDHGPIVLQRVIAVAEGETPESLAERVFAEECLAYPEALRLCVTERVHLKEGRVVFSEATRGAI